MSLHSNDNLDIFWILLVLIDNPLVAIIFLIIAFIIICQGWNYEQAMRPTWDNNVNYEAELWLDNTYGNGEIISKRIEEGSVYHLNARILNNDIIQVISFDCDAEKNICEVCYE